MAEKFSKFRDPGTGIQVFLTPVAASTSSSPGSSGASLGIAGLVLTPVFVLLGIVRVVVGGLFWGLYLLIGSAGLLKVVLGSLGFVRLSVETVSAGGSGRSRGNRQNVGNGVGVAKKGDLVLANHSSYIDLLILSYLYPGIKFVVPVIADGVKDDLVKTDSSSVSGAGRRTPKKNAMSANTRIVTPSSASAISSPTTEIPIEGYTTLALRAALHFVGGLPPSRSQVSNAIVYPDLDSVLKTATSVLAMFPEVVTSNNRALLNITTLPSTTPSALKSAHVVSLKYAAPSVTSSTSIYVVPAPTNSVAKHLVDMVLLSSPVRSVNIRHTILATSPDDNWREQIAATLSTMARLKRTSIAWSAKAEFLSMVQARNKRV